MDRFKVYFQLLVVVATTGGIILCPGAHSAPICAGERPGFDSAEHVVIIGTDGLGGVYLENATHFLPNINRFFLEGATTTRARNKRRCESGPNWSAVITGMGPQESGIHSNEWVPPVNGSLPDVAPISGSGKIPETMWRAAKTQDSSVVVAVTESWDWIYYLVEDGIVDYNFRCHSVDPVCIPQIHALHFIRDKCPNLMFIHLDSIDQAGHNYTWGSQQFYDAAKIVDGYIGEIMDAYVKADIFDQTLFIIVSDHGGYGLDHGKFDEICIRIPILAMGPKVKKRHTLTGYCSNVDVAPTALHALGLQPGQFMVGKVLEDIFIS